MRMVQLSWGNWGLERFNICPKTDSQTVVELGLDIVAIKRWNKIILFLKFLIVYKGNAYWSKIIGDFLEVQSLFSLEKESKTGILVCESSSDTQSPFLKNLEI